MSWRRKRDSNGLRATTTCFSRETTCTNKRIVPKEEIVSNDNRGEEVATHDQQIMKKIFETKVINIFSEEYMQHMKDNNSQFQTVLYVEIEKLRKLMKEVPMKRYIDVIRTINSKGYLITKEYTIRMNGRLQHKIWKPRVEEQNRKTNEQQHKRKRNLLQHKVWDPGGLAQREHMTRRS